MILIFYNLIELILFKNMIKIMNHFRLRNNYGLSNNITTQGRNYFNKIKMRSLKYFSNSRSNDSNESQQDGENTKQEKEKKNKTEYPEIIKMLFEKNVKLKKLPCFEVYSSQIEILHQPMDFYLAIIVKLTFII